MPFPYATNSYYPPASIGEAATARFEIPGYSVLFIGIFAGRGRVSSVADYIVAGRSLGFIVMYFLLGVENIVLQLLISLQL